MTSLIDATAETVAGVFSEAYKLHVPYFQREYAWRCEHVERLLSDLLRIMDGEGPIDWYPLGTIILYQEADHRGMAISDGHQRLMTLTILLAILRDNAPDSPLRDRLARCLATADKSFRLRTLKSAQPFFAQLVQADGATNHPCNKDEMTLSGSEEAILANRDWLNAKLRTASPERCRQLAESFSTAVAWCS